MVTKAEKEIFLRLRGWRNGWAFGGQLNPAIWVFEFEKRTNGWWYLANPRKIRRARDFYHWTLEEAYYYEIGSPELWNERTV